MYEIERAQGYERRPMGLLPYAHVLDIAWRSCFCTFAIAPQPAMLPCMERRG